MEIAIKGDAKEIADLVLELQEQYEKNVRLGSRAGRYGSGRMVCDYAGDVASSGFAT